MKMTVTFWALVPAIGGVLVLVTAAALTGCGAKVLDYRNATISSGKIYQGNENEPFNGKLTNVPEFVIFPRDAAISVLRPLDDVRKELDGANQYFRDTGPCVVTVKDGLPNGEADCKFRQSELARSTITFRNGVLSGAVKIYAFPPQKHVVADAAFKDGRLEGKHQIFSPENGKKIWEATWKDGVKDGAETVWDEGTGNVIGRANYVAGKPQGDVVRYAPDGKRLIYRAHLEGGLFEGVEEEFEPTTGRPLKYVEWKAGRKNGVERAWNWPGQPPFESQCNQDVCRVTKRPEDAQTQAAAPSASPVGCVDRWIAAHHKVAGPDAMIAADQLSEWEEWCAKGTVPN
jgi:antitoxin component YwqK of YwqJK toxin-antitoxin module